MLDAIERDRGVAVTDRLAERLPSRLLARVSLESVRACSPVDTLSLDDGEELLLAFDSLVGDGSGRVLEQAAVELTSHTLSHDPGIVRVRDLMGTVARMRTVLERPFVGAQLLFELSKTEAGFSLTVGVPGRSRAARLLRHLVVGALQAADRYALGTGREQLRLDSELRGDRAVITARYRMSVSEPPEETPPESLPRPSRPRVRQSLSEEVERILGPGRPSQVGSPDGGPERLADWARKTGEQNPAEGPLSAGSRRPRSEQFPALTDPNDDPEPVE
ncbi:MAG TPA: hypothetical protein VGJ84_18165 [Polyangiaceae bacterium]